MFTTLNSKLKRMLSVILALSMVLSPIMTFAEEVGEAVATALEEPIAVVYAGSDFQPRKVTGQYDANGEPTGGSDLNAGISQMGAIADKINADYKDLVTGALFCGDYSLYSKYKSNTNYANAVRITEDGIAIVESILGSKFGLSREEIVMIQGNHDFYISPLDFTGAHDTLNYGVYAINEKDFMYQQGTLANGEDTVKKTASGLEAYLKAKVNQQYNKPIFIVNHVPLHHGARSEDNRYAKHLFDVINKYGGQGLTIIYLFGHNHSKGYDAHIGEGAIYLKPGEVMCVPNGTTTIRDGKTVYGYDKETLNFAYMNAGYTGHFTVNPDGHTDDTLTSTAFVIYEDRVEIKRYDINGLHQLKAPGKHLAAYEAHDLHIYTHAIDKNGDVIRLDNKFNVSLNIDSLYPESKVDSTVVTGVTAKTGEFQKEDKNAVTNKVTESKTLTLPVAKNFKANSEGFIGIDYVSEEFYIDSVSSSDTGVATVTPQDDGNILVKGVKAGATTLTVVAKHREGAYADVVLTYDLVVCPDTVTNLGYTRYELINATLVKSQNDSVDDEKNIIYATKDAGFQVGESYVFVNTYKSSTSAWAYAMLNSESSPASRSRNVAIYGSARAHATIKNCYVGTFIDSCDEYMEWVYCSGGYLRNAATGLFLGNNVGKDDENEGVTLRNFSLSDVCPRDFDKNGNTNNDFNKWNCGSFGPYIDDKIDQDVSSTTHDEDLGYRRYLRYDSSTKTFKAEMITDYTKNAAGRGQQYSNVCVYRKVTKGSDRTCTAWVDTTDIYAIKGDLTGKTNATLYISDGMNVTAVPVTVNMLVSATKYVESTTEAGTVATNFKVRYDDVDVATDVKLTLVDGITKKTDSNKTIKVGDNTTKVTFNVTAAGATVSYSYESLDKRYVTVAQDGTVTGVNVGGASVRITALVKYGDSAPIAVTDDVYVTVNPSDTCFNNVRKFGDNSVYVLTDSLKSYTGTNKDDATKKYKYTEPFMIVSTNAPGEAFAMQSDWGRNNNFVPAPITVESYNGKYFISDLNDASLVWKLTQDSNFYYGGTLYKNGATSDKSGNYLPTKSYYQLDNTKYVGLDFLIALKDFNHAGHATTLDYGTGLFASIGKDALPQDAINNVFPTINYLNSTTKEISDTKTSYNNYAAAWNYAQSELGFAAINYVPSKDDDNRFDDTSSDHFTYILTFDRDIENFKSVYHKNEWPGDLNKKYADKYYEGRVFAYTKQTVQTPGVTIWVSSKNGTVGLNATHDTPTGAMLNITTHSPEGVSTVSYPITYGMLEKEGMKTDTKQTYTNVKIPYTYNGTKYNICGSFTLNVSDTTKDYPTYPDQGSVNTTKTLDTSKNPYSSTGVSHIDLTVSGVPVSNGADVVIMLDASTSMQEKVGGSDGEPRLKMLYRALVELMETLKTPDENGKYADVDVSIASFNGQTYIDSNYLISPLKNLIGCDCHADAIYYYYNHADKSTVNLPFADVTDPSYDAFIESLQYDLVHAYFGKDNDKTGEKCNVKTIKPSSGTNYDRAMELTYDLLKEKQEVNAARGENRKQYVIFMSDGESWQFNYFGGRNANSGSHTAYKGTNGGYAFHDQYGLAKWMYVLSGTVMENDDEITDFTDTRWHDNSVDTTPFIAVDQQEIFKKYYNPDGKHWMAEAIKAPKTELCKIIDPDSTNEDKIEEVYGLGATMYTMAFAIGSDAGKGLDEELIEDVVRRMATSDAHFTNITDSSDTYEELKGAMLKIKSDVKSAGDAMYVDQMGDDFDLQMKTKYQVGNEWYELENAPLITLTSYPLYKYWEVGSVVEGVLVTEDMVGKRKLSRTGTEIEKIWFDDGGAYSSLIKEEDSNININILSDEIIKGKNIWYNTGDTVYTLTDADKLNVPAFGVRGITELQPETFYWVVGEVPEDEYVLGYDVYLEGSMEGTALAGQHDTNNFAELTYKNHLDHICEKSVPSPKLPWDKAYVGVGFYFVNEYGQPLVNRYGGQTGSFEKALKLDSIHYYEFPLNASGSVQASKEIIAKDVLPDGYMLYDKDAAYKVFATSSNELVPNWTITKDPNLKYASTYVTQFSSTVTSSNKLEESDPSYSYTNTIIYFAIYGSVTAASDTVVVDYGLPVNINLLQNDVLFDDQATLVALGVDLKTAPEFKEELDKKRNELLGGFKNSSGIQITYSGKFGTAEILTSEETVCTVKYPVGTSIRYTLNTANSMEFNEKETFSYAADYQGDIGIQGYYYANVNIIPATIVYYEEDFAEFKVYDLDKKDYTNNANADPTGGDDHSYWSSSTTEDTPAVSGVQGEDRPGHLTQNDMNNLYGYDTAYSDSFEASLRTLKEITLKPKTNNPNANDLGRYEAEVSFTFYGTGFDVISASSKGTAPLLVKVYKVNEGEIKLGSNGFPEGKPVISKFVDTYYGYTYNETTGEWEVTSDGPNALYQIPVIKCKDLKYGRYKVYITTSYNEKSDHSNARSYTLYFDGIRIYDPVNNGVLNGEADNVIQDAYIKDNEAWPIFKEVRNLLIDADSFGALTHDNFTTGVVFIDGARTNTSISDYTNYGPNNEVYLTGQQAIAFDLRGNNASGVHIAMKCTRNYTVNAVIYSITKDSNGKVNIKDTITINGINTAADFYYDISKFKDSIVVVKNNSEASSSTATDPNILSITNLKFTYESKEKHDLDLDQSPVKMSKGAGNAVVTAMRMVNTPWLEPDVEIPNVFLPEQFDVSVSKTEVRQGSTVTVTVNTSADVDHITVNGVEVTKYTKSWFTAERQWKYTVHIDEAGNTPITVVAYNADGEASDELTNTVSATERVNLVSTANGSMLDRMYSGWVETLSAKAN